MDYRPQSPDLSSYAPRSPDLSGLGRPESPDLSGLHSPRFGSGFQQQHHHSRFGPAFGGNAFEAPLSHSPTSVPQQQHQQAQYNYNYQQSMGMAPGRGVKSEDDDDYMPDAPESKRARKGPKQALPMSGANGGQIAHSSGDPTLGVALKTSFPVARIKRIMQADEDVGKVAQVTPHVVSRALELFMIKLISASAQQSRGSSAAQAGGGGKGPKKILVQHMKKAIQADETFDFLNEIAEKVPDASSKAAKKEGSDSEDARPRKRATAGKRRKGSGDEV